jgi:hypothetical protein
MNDEAEKLSLWAAVKDNWAQVTAIAAGLVIAHLFVMSVLVDRAVSTKLSEQDLATDSNIVTMNSEIDANAAAAAANTTRIEGNERRVEQAFTAMWRIMRGEPPENPGN